MSAAKMEREEKVVSTMVEHVLNMNGALVSSLAPKKKRKGREET